MELVQSCNKPTIHVRFTVTSHERYGVSDHGQLDCLFHSVMTSSARILYRSSIIVLLNVVVFGLVKWASYLPSFSVTKRISNIKKKTPYFSDCFVELFPCGLLIQTGVFTNPWDWGFPGNSFHSPPRGPWSIPVAPYYRKPPNCARGIYHYEYTLQLQMH